MPKHYWSQDSRMPLMQGTALAWRTAHPEQPIHPPLYLLLRPVGCPVFCHVIQCHTQAECKTSVHSSQSAQYCNLDRADLRDGITIPFDLFSEGQLWCYRNKWICGAGQLDPARDGAVSWRPKARTACSFYALSSVPLLVKLWSSDQQYSIPQKPS